MVKQRFLLDTNVLAEAVRPKASLSVLSKLEEHRGRTAISTISWFEALRGLYRLPPGSRRDLIGKYLLEVVAATMPVLPYDAACAEWHAAQAVRLEAAGKTAPYADGQIAAVAAVNGLVLVSRNVADFERFDGVDVQNWW